MSNKLYNYNKNIQNNIQNNYFIDNYFLFDVSSKIQRKSIFKRMDNQREV